jgi:kojibiose phosphorylase
MKNFFEHKLSPDPWLIHEPVFDPLKMQEYESLFTLGNGYLGSRGVLEEIPTNSSPGTYIAGLFDKSISQVSEIVNLPNPVDLRFSIEGEKFDLKGMYIHNHQRILDMRKGLLFRHSVLANSKKQRFDYQSLRFLSSDDKHIGAMRVYITPLDDDCILTVQDNINISVRNKGVLTEGRKKHFQIKEVRNEHSVNYISAKTQQSNVSFTCATSLQVRQRSKTFYAPDQSFDIRLKKNETLALSKIFYINACTGSSQVYMRKRAVRHIKKSAQIGFNDLLKRHVAKFSGAWRYSDIQISGDRQSQKALRFNIYHMIIAARADNKDVGIGARTLSGEGYRGHVFWDTEIFLLPFYIFTFPEIARKILLYRYNRLEAARRIARRKGFRGALFPWESADTGEDQTPRWHKDFDGRIIHITTQDYEHHIVSDIAYGLWQYYLATNDKKFMLRYGAEMLFETARFYTSRVSFDKKRNRYEIRNVMGPDEFHGNVNNNAYTNGLAKWNLKTASDLYNDLMKSHPRPLCSIQSRIGLKKDEPEKWLDIADRMYIPLNKKRNIVVAFDGYLKKKDITIKSFTKNFMPDFPSDVSFSTVSRTQLVKQLDACMLLYLLPDSFSQKVVKNTVAYYEKRTVHKSSLSPSINSIMNLRTNNNLKAYQYFLNSLGADIHMYQDNVAEGIHAASLGGTWQAVVFGFAGMSIKDNTLCFNPRPPDYWHRLTFFARWRDHLLHIKINRNRISIKSDMSGSSKPIPVRVSGRLYEMGKSMRAVFAEKPL